MKTHVYAPLSAVLGPTNTGKTHLAVERMIGHTSGMMGFPLRLLAREVYDRVVALRGEAAVALVTGEERIWPETARYLLCTAEAMPLDAQIREQGSDTLRDVAFVALDEAQIGQDRERGHVFTSRLLHARGREETMILGSGSLAPAVRSLLPDALITTRPRFSTLTYDGPRKLQRLPQRSVIVAFSAEEVYSIAEALRRVSGGAAVVMGALSPATRNAQVAMFQAGEVDYLVATDAIGMGLNLDVSHVAFASLNKFDGVRQRRLTVAEMAQIAGRAGRHQRDGTFGSVGSEAAFTEEEIHAIEEHHFPPMDWLYWRNPYPDTGSLAALLSTLEAPPPHPTLRPAPESTDLAVLRRMSEDADATALVDGPAAVRRLWSASSLPDFRKSGPEAHGRLVARLWQDLGRGNGHIEADWFSGQLRALDNAEGSVEQLADRIAAVRTFCYIAHRPDWLADPAGMAGDARAIEARLSDALHNALTARFVDRRTTVLLRALGQDPSSLPVKVSDEGLVRVDGEAIGQLEGFTFRVDPAARATDQRMLLAAAERYLAVELASRATALASAPDAHLALVLDDGQMPTLQWHGLAVATLTKGRHRLSPKVLLDKPVAALDSHVVAAVVARLQRYLDENLGRHLRPLISMAARARDADAAPGLRATLAALVDAGGHHEREPLDQGIASLPPEARDELRRFGVRVGSIDLFHPLLLKPAPLRWLTALESAWTNAPATIPPQPGIGLLKAAGEETPNPAGFRRVGDWWLRVDLAERIAHHTHEQRRAQLDAANKARKAKASTPAPATVAAAEAPVDAEAPPEAPVAVKAEIRASTNEPAAAPLVATADAPAQDAAAIPVPEERRPDGGFRIDPELARSIGLPLEDRIAMLRLLGFRPDTPTGPLTVDLEPLIWWVWRGRKASPPRGARNERGRRPHRAEGGQDQRNRRRDPAGAAEDNRARFKGKGDNRGKGGQDRFAGKERGHQGKRQGGDQGGPRDRSAPRPPARATVNAHSPFAALAGLFDNKVKPAKTAKPVKEAQADHDKPESVKRKDGEA